MSRCEPPDVTRAATYWLLNPDGSAKVGVWRPPSGPLSSGAWDTGGIVASCDLWTRYGWTCGPAVPTPEELDALLKAARALLRYSMSDEGHSIYVENMRAALAAPSFKERTDGE